MIRNFLKVTLRNLWRNKTFSIINIAGLTIGMAAAMLIMLWVQNELSYDRFYKNADNIALLYSRDMNNGRVDLWSNTCALIAPELKKDYPEVKEAARFRTVYFLTTVGDKHFNTEGAFAELSIAGGRRQKRVERQPQHRDHQINGGKAVRQRRADG
jgi:hypothetical protein